MPNVEDYDFAVWGTQGGGLAKWDNSRVSYVFVESPDWWPNQEGKEVPKEWGIMPANEKAFRVMHDEMYNEDRSFDDYI